MKKNVHKDSVADHSGALPQPGTDPSQAERFLTESRNNFLHFFNASVDFHWVLDRQGTILEINDTVKNRLGYQKEELTGKSVIEVHPPSMRKQVQHIVTEMLEGKKQNCPVPLQTKDGHEIPVETRVFEGQWDGMPCLFGVSRDISVLKLSEEKFTRAFHHSPNMIGLSDMETGEYVEVNQAFYDIMEYSPDEIQGKKVAGLVRMEPSFRKKALAMLKKEGVLRNLETTLYSKTGRAVHVLLSADIIRIGDKEYNLTTGVDITDRKRVEQTLQENESHFADIFQSVTEGICYSTMKGEVIKVNEALVRITGINEQELVGRNIVHLARKFLSAGHIPKALSFLTGLISGKEIQPIEVEINKKIVEISATRNKTTNRLVGVLRDVSAQHKALHDLEKSSERLKSFLHISREITSAIDHQKIMQMVVDNAVIIMGLGSGAVYLQHSNDTVRLAATTPALPSGFPEAFRLARVQDHPHIQKAFLTGKPVIMADALVSNLTPAEEEIVRIRDLRSNLYLPVVLRGKTLGVLILSSTKKTYVFADEEIQLLQGYANQAAQIIENNRNYDSLKQYAKDLEKEVQERKRVESDLITAKEKAEESDRLKSAFLQNMSHEIRTPLNGIIGFSELLNNPATNAEKRKHFTDIIIENGWQLTSIIDDIITISSLETGQEQLRTDKVDVNRLIGDQLARFAQQADKKGLRLASGDLLAEDDAMVYADKARLGQIFNNLILNALKFTEHGEVVIGCRKQADQLRFYVRDTGIGIDKSKANLVFERFAQADDSMRVKYGGTGLGLSICKGFVELMGGKIWVESEPGQGATFWFTIPCKRVLSIREDIPHRHALEAGDHPILVLVAEDEEFNFLYLEALLEVLAETVNLRIIHAVDGRQAVDICREQAVDLVLMDIKMPIMDGHTAAKLIREFKPNLPIIAQTAYALKSEMEQFVDVFNDYITKPFSLEKLRLVFTKFVNAG